MTVTTAQPFDLTHASLPVESVTTHMIRSAQCISVCACVCVWGRNGNMFRKTSVQRFSLHVYHLKTPNCL